MLLACEESEEKQATAVDEFLHHPFQAEAEAELNNVESSNSDNVLVTPESPVSEFRFGENRLNCCAQNVLIFYVCVTKITQTAQKRSEKYSS